MLVARQGSLVRLPEFLAIWAPSAAAGSCYLDSRRGGWQIVPPRAPAAAQPLSFPPAPMLELLDTATRTLAHHSAPVTLVADWCCLELATDDGDLLRTLLEVPTDPSLSSNGHQLVLVFRTSLPPRELTVMPGFAVIEIGLPDSAERRYVLAESHDRTAIPLDPGLSVPGVATTLGGIDSDGLLRTAHEARAGAPLSVTRITDIKAAEIERVAGGTLVVDRSPPPTGLPGWPACATSSSHI